MDFPPPECTCGSKQAGLIYIAGRYQCGKCICESYADLAEISTITLDEDPLQGVRNMNKLRKEQDDVLKGTTETLAELTRVIDKLTKECSEKELTQKCIAKNKLLDEIKEVVADAETAEDAGGLFDCVMSIGKMIDKHRDG